MLDLHWSDAGEWGKQIGQHVMPDQNSVAFWNDVATTYKNHPAVIFDLYNEPRRQLGHLAQGRQGLGTGPANGPEASIRRSACRRLAGYRAPTGAG
jgi:aryl-phospho-beta-D-glucosidase BglC (GH1 family)